MEKNKVYSSMGDQITRAQVPFADSGICSALIRDQNEQEENTRPSTRTKALTLKGREYQFDVSERNYYKAQKAWKKQVNKVESTLADSTEIAELQQQRAALENLTEDLTNAYEIVFEFLESVDDRAIAEERHSGSINEYQVLFKKLNYKIAQLNQEKEDQVSRYSRSSKRSRSTHRSNSSSSSTLSKKVGMAVKVARLGAELSFHDIENQEAAFIKGVSCNQSRNRSSCTSRG